jgi:hypothetical protein
LLPHPYRRPARGACARGIYRYIQRLPHSRVGMLPGSRVLDPPHGPAKSCTRATPHTWHQIGACRAPRGRTWTWPSRALGRHCTSGARLEPTAEVLRACRRLVAQRRVRVHPPTREAFNKQRVGVDSTAFNKQRVGVDSTSFISPRVRCVTRPRGPAARVDGVGALMESRQPRKPPSRVCFMFKPTQSLNAS